MKIAIAGAGAIGGNDVLLIDGWQEHINAIKENGLKANYNGEEITVKVSIVNQNEVPTGEQFDLIILFTKAMQLEKMLQDVKPLIADHTEVLCLLNGIGHEDVIEKFVPMEKIFIGNTMWTAGLEGPGKAKLFGSGSVIVNEFAAVAAKENVNLDIPEVIEHVETCFDPTTIGMHFPSMHQDLIKNNRLTEIDYINGAISRKGKKYGVVTPYCDFLTQLVHSKEEILGAKQ